MLDFSLVGPGGAVLLRRAKASLAPAATLVAIAFAALTYAGPASAAISVELSDEAARAIRDGGRDAEAEREGLEKDFNDGLRELAKTDADVKALFDSGQTLRIVCFGSKETRDAGLTEGPGHMGVPAETRGDFDSAGKPKAGGTALIAIDCGTLKTVGLDTPLIGFVPESTLFLVLVHEILHATNRSRRHPPDDLDLYEKFVQDFRDALARAREVGRAEGGTTFPPPDSDGEPAADSQNVGFARGLSFDIAPARSRVSLETRLGSGVLIDGTNKSYFVASPDEVWRNGARLSLSYGLGDGADDERAAPSISTYFYGSFEFAGNDDTQSDELAGGMRIYGLSYAELAPCATCPGGVSSGVSAMGSAGFGLRTRLRTDISWQVGEIGIGTRIANAFGHPNVDLGLRLGLQAEGFDQAYEAEGQLTFLGADIPVRQYLEAAAEDCYFGVSFGGSLSYQIAPRISASIGATGTTAYHQSTAHFRQTTESIVDPLFVDIAREHHESGLSFYGGFNLDISYAMSPNANLVVGYERSYLPGVTAIRITENAEAEPSSFKNELTTRDFVRALLSLTF